MAPRGWHGRGAQNRHYGPPRCRQDILPSEGHRDARGRRPQGRRHDHGADCEAESAGRLLRDGLGVQGEACVRLPRDPVEDDGRPVRCGHQRARRGRRARAAIRDRERRRDRDRRGRQDGGRIAELCPGCEGRLGRGQAVAPDAPQEVPQSASPGYPSAGRRTNPRSDDGESEPLALQDRETDEGRGPLGRRDICLAGIAAVVDRPFAVQDVKEGAARLLVPDVPRRKGPGTAGPWPFYNPTMTVNRDLAAVVLAKWPRRPRTVLDGLAATGAWGIRMQLEAGPYEITFNDRSTLAVDLIRENLRRNRILGDVVNGEMVSLLGTDQYDFVDVDPFGPPTPFLGALLEHAKSGPGLGGPATDRPVLGGRYAAACLRRYQARPLRCPPGSAVCLRILLGFCERLAAEAGKAIRPVLSFAAAHFLRIYVTVDRRTGDSSLGFVRRRSHGELIPARADADAIGPL